MMSPMIPNDDTSETNPIRPQDHQGGQSLFSIQSKMNKLVIEDGNTEYVQMNQLLSSVWKQNLTMKMEQGCRVSTQASSDPAS